MLIRKNTKAFKTILDIVWNCQNREDRDKLIRLYITRAGQALQNRISVEGIQGDAALFYEMNYQTVLNNLQSSNHQLHVSDDIPGIYFFHSTSNKVWDEAPFEFDDAIKKEFSSLPELPVTRKKEKPEKFIFPSGKSEAPTQKGKTTKEVKATKKAVLKSKPAETKPSGPKQPDYKLKRKIEFTDLGKIIFRQPQVDKKEVLDYYSKVSQHLLPHLKDRPLTIRVRADQSPLPLTPEALMEERGEQLPDWIQSAIVFTGKSKSKMLLCNDREHLLYYVEMGCIEFSPFHAKMKSLHSPDYIIVVLDSPAYEIASAVEAALVTKQILDGLKLPSFIKTDGLSGLHIYIPLDSKSKFQRGHDAAVFICKLVSLKAPNLVAVAGSDDKGYGKVSLDYSLNEEGGSIVAPYSLVPGQSPVVATPILWEELDEKLRPDDFNPESIFKRIKQTGDSFEGFLKKKVNADALVEALEERYGFLFS
jgi:bifunctional non-homologous end joining protein LigD